MSDSGEDPPASNAGSDTGPLSLTFGVEIEHLFGLDKDQVNTSQAHPWLRLENCPFRVDGPADEVPDYPGDNAEMKIWRAKRLGKGIKQAAKIIRQEEPQLVMRVDSENMNQSGEYSNWKLVWETAVPIPKQSEQLSEWSKDEGEVRIEDLDEWTLLGLELVSPPLTIPESAATDLQCDGLTELRRLIQAMPTGYDSERPYFFTTVPCLGSIHVHIGMAPGTDSIQHGLPISFVQHLAFICMTFENAITLLHHPERHSYQGSKIFEHAKSNRDIVRPMENQHRCDSGPAYSREEAFLQVFKAEHRQLLHKLLNKTPDSESTVRERFVNFTNATDEEPKKYLKRTVEFRQHHGTLKAEEICEWVVFVMALARAAERKANETLPQDTPIPSFIIKENVADDIKDEARKYAAIFAVGKMRNLEELFDLMELPVARRRYWWARAEANRKLWAEEYKGKSTCDPLPIWNPELECTFPPVRDCEGWGDAELVPPKYADEHDDSQSADAGAPDMLTSTGESPAPLSASVIDTVVGFKRQLEEDEDDDVEPRPQKKQALDNEADDS